MSTAPLATATPTEAVSPSNTTLTTSLLLHSFDDRAWKLNFLELAKCNMMTRTFGQPSNVTPYLSEWIQKQHLDYTKFLAQLEGTSSPTDDVVTFNVCKLELLRQQGFQFQRIVPPGSNVEQSIQRAPPPPPPIHATTPPSEPAVAPSPSTETPETTKTVSRSELNWNERADRLREYRDEHGHCDPPVKESERKYRGLGSWVSKWRKIVKEASKVDDNNNNNNSDKYVIISPARLARLRDIGIIALRNKASRVERQEENWEKFFLEMKQFQEEQGHTIVPEKTHPSLRNWLVVQRKEYAKMSQGEPSQMTPLQLRRLTSIGFSFEARPKYTFDERFDQWIQYKEQHDGRDPTSANALGKWICKTRLKYHAKMAGQPSVLTDEQVDRLNQNGFIWSKAVTKTETLTWDERFQELCGYMQQHGTTVVPQNMTGLGQWVHKQRCLYQKHLGGETSSLSKDRIDRLNSIDFCWVVRERSLKRPVKHLSSSSESDEEEESAQLLSSKRHKVEALDYGHFSYGQI